MLSAPRSTRETAETERLCPCGITFYADHPCSSADGLEDLCLDCCTECSSGGAGGPLGAAS